MSNPAKGNRTARRIKDWVVAGIVRAGGLSVVFAVVLIFVYLMYKVLPLLQSSEQSEPVKQALFSQQGLYHAVNEYGDVLLQVNPLAQLNYRYLFGAKAIKQQESAFADEAVKITAFSSLDDEKQSYLWVLADGSAVRVNHQFEVSYQKNGQRISSPKMVLAWGDERLFLAEKISKVAAREDDQTLRISSLIGKELRLFTFDKIESLFGDSLRFEEIQNVKLNVGHAVDFLLMNDDGRWLYAIAKNGKMTAFKLFAEDINASATRHQVVQSPVEVTAVSWLLGNNSLLVGDSSGYVHQWFNSRSPTQTYLGLLPQHIRSVKATDAAITWIHKIQQKKIFLVGSEQGELTGFYSSSAKRLFKSKIPQSRMATIVSNPDGSKLFLQNQHLQWYYLPVDDPHPEVSIKQLWQKIHYEGYDEPKYIWQSSASNQDFEPKFSLTPLVFGTIKAAFYAMLFAMPLAILGAIYTAFFMSGKMRRIVKPTIEIMEALPTVILGFLAGLWLAPFVENYLLAVCLVFMVLPLGVLGFGYFSSCLSQEVKSRLFLLEIEHRAMVLMPVIAGLILFSFAISEPLQNWLFAGDFRQYLTQEWEITYNQRNAMVVGIAMGFAVIPTIFSLTEDAIYSVPKHLVNGSLAMGASPWQTLAGVVLPTASPGIFSAVMIGFGRAVGETMIVLMATGNTPVLEANIFEGMRTLAANIAVEMPESAVDSSHFRILFLAALVLFVFTFTVNTIAETVRQHLKKKYSEL